MKSSNYRIKLQPVEQGILNDQLEHKKGLPFSEPKLLTRTYFWNFEMRFWVEYGSGQVNHF